MTSQKRNIILLAVVAVVVIAGIVLVLLLNNGNDNGNSVTTGINVEDQGGSDSANGAKDEGAKDEGASNSSGNNAGNNNNQSSSNNNAKSDDVKEEEKKEEPAPAQQEPEQKEEPAQQQEPEKKDEPAPAQQEPEKKDEPAPQAPAASVQIDSLLPNPSFEDPSNLIWVSRGGPKVEITSEEAHSGSYSLKTSGRTKTWEGPIVHVTDILEKGKTYYVSIYLKYNGPSDAQTFNLQFETDSAAGVQYPTVKSQEVKRGEWTLIEGEYTIPEDLTRYSIYVEVPWKADDQITESDIVDFYIDDIVVKLVN